MADLMTHMATGLLVKSATRGPYTAAMVAGTVLPDLGARVPSMGFSKLAQSGVDVPPEIPYAFEVLHMPVGILFMCCIVACFFEVEQRQGVFLNLLGGCFLHLALDVTQDHMGVGYMLAYPFSISDFEFGWMGSEATVPWALILSPIALVVWWLRHRPRGGRAQSEST